MKFRWDADLSVLWAGERSYPARFRRESASDYIPAGADIWERYPDYRMETRAATVCFENQWCLSTIWGDATYSSNRIGITPRTDFIEEPHQVEVGVLMPTPITRPAKHFDLPSGRQVDLPESESCLWGDPLSYVTVPEYHRLADLVMMLPYDIDLPEGEWDDVTGFCDLLITAGLAKTL